MAVIDGVLLSTVPPQVFGSATRVAGLPAPQEVPPPPRQGQELPQGRPEQAGAPDRLPGLQGRHDAHRP